MTEIWERVFADKQLMWGREPTLSAIFAKDYFVRMGVRDVLIPGVGYGRNAKLFLEHGMSVTGIEISETAIALAREQLGLDIPIHHGSVSNMPFDTRQYDGIFCYGLIYLLDAEGRGAQPDMLEQLRPRSIDLHRYQRTIHVRQGPEGELVPIHRHEMFSTSDSVEREWGHGIVETPAR